MARRRRTDKAVAGLRELARAQSNAPPPGFENYGIDWSTLTPKEKFIVMLFAAALREIRENELALLRLGTVDYFRGAIAELRRQAHDG